MIVPPGNTGPIAERLLSLDGRQGAVRLLIYEPAPAAEGSGYVCAYEISGLSISNRYVSNGRDSLEALVEALRDLGDRVHSSHEYAGKRLRWMLDDEDLGLPRR
jgi:hypothetical protein